MHTLIDDFVVGFLVAGSLAYALLALGPRALRGRLLTGTAALLDLLPRRARLATLVQRLHAAAKGRAAGACGGCDSCGAEPKPAAPGPAEIHIPLSRIGRR
jgi:hypothetical protein